MGRLGDRPSYSKCDGRKEEPKHGSCTAGDGMSASEEGTAPLALCQEAVGKLLVKLKLLVFI